VHYTNETTSKREREREREKKRKDLITSGLQVLLP